VLELVWLDVDALAATAKDLCSEGEWDRASRILSKPARQRSLAGAVTVRLLAARHLGGAPSQVRVRRQCPMCGAEGHHGRPSLAGVDGLHLSISHVGDWVIGAVTDLGPVGVDADDPARVQFPEFAGLALHPREIESLVRYPNTAHGDRGAQGRDDSAGARIWVRKEAFLKCIGVGLMVSPNQVRTNWPAAPCQVLEWPAAITGWMQAQPPPQVVDVPSPAPLVAAIAISTRQRFEVKFLASL
jgi:4'-phosphopantetheinyl transferase